MPTVSGMLNTDAMNFEVPSAGWKTLHRFEARRCRHPERTQEYQGKFKDRAGLYKEAPDRMEKVREYNRKLSK